MHRLFKWTAVATILPLLVWSCLALAFFPGLPGWLATALSLGWAAVAVAGNYRSRCAPRWLALTGAGVAAVALVFFARNPTDFRDWRPDQDRHVRVAFHDGTVHIQNLRNTLYRADGQVESRSWNAENFVLAELERVDFVQEILSDNGLVAHGFLSFGFADGRYLAVSVEARRVEGQEYSPLRGLFRNYELIYIVGEETDLIGMRTNVRKNPVYVYPIRTSPARVQALFHSVLVRADGLGTEPEFYHTFTSSCVTNLRAHVNALGGDRIRPDLRILLPGLADGLLHELELVDFVGSREEARRRFRINDRSAPLLDPLAWSRQIREPPGP